MDDNEVLDVQETNGENNNGIVTDGLEPEVVDPKDNDNGTSGNAGGIASEDEEEDGDNPVTPPVDDPQNPPVDNPVTPPVDDPAEDDSEDAAAKAHMYYCMQMLSVMTGL